MRRSTGWIGSICLVSLGWGAAIAAAGPGQDIAFDKLKALSGEWQTDLPGFGKMSNTIREISGGKAIEETIGTPAENETSIYTLRDGRTLLTHYCAMTPDGHQVWLETGPARGAPDSFLSGVRPPV
jgi:hypothetical protein